MSNWERFLRPYNLVGMLACLAICVWRIAAGQGLVWVIVGVCSVLAFLVWWKVKS